MNSNNTELILVLGTGRNGSYQMHKIFENSKLINSYHEHNFNKILKIGTLKQFDAISNHKFKNKLKHEYIDHLKSEKGCRHIDFSNALPWVSDGLTAINKNTKTIFLARNGIKVVSSFFYKFKDIMYPEKIFNDTIKWKESGFEKDLEPPLNKAYWRPIIPEMLDSNNLEAGRRFKMIYYYWKICCDQSLKIIKKSRNPLIFKFEELLTKQNKRYEFCDYVGENKEFLENKFKSPINVEKPISYEFNQEQNQVFKSICSQTMEVLDYKMENYKVNY